ncbi:MAG TPA: HipA domain-containing protein [Burkholderiaceae bacterium]|nr:HipA domain-containing protein [Burkholderiaceae bacterium]
MSSERLYVYLQRPDSGEWVTAGRYRAETDAAGSTVGEFMYAPSYVAAGHTWSIDPVGLPFIPERRWRAPRHRGLHDVLRDACPDTWGQAVLRKEHGLPENTPPARYLVLAGNDERWGALAVGTSKVPSIIELQRPRLTQLDDLSRELRAMAEGRPAIIGKLRRRLVHTSSLGGARPKTTVRDDEGRAWLVKPRLASDTADVPRLEHATHLWGKACGLDFATTMLHAGDEFSAVRVLRFDRDGAQRLMCVSAATLLQTEYPGGGAGETSRCSYPRLAEELQRIGAPPEDRQELFGRMVFNAVCGNDDDHVRNHAVVYRPQDGRWRLTPAFDVVPNCAQMPERLAMQLSVGRFDISGESVVADAVRFGFDSRLQAERHLDRLLDRIEAAFDAAGAVIDAEWRDELGRRMATALGRLRSRTRNDA